MKKYLVRIYPELGDFISHLHPLLKTKIRKALEEIEHNPYLGKPLKEELKGLYSYRVSQYRIVYRIRHHEILIEVLDIADRKTIYQSCRGFEVSRILSGGLDSRRENNIRLGPGRLEFEGRAGRSRRFESTNNTGVREYEDRSRRIGCDIYRRR